MKITTGFLFVGSLLALGSALTVVGCSDETGTTTTTTSSSSAASSTSGGGGGDGTGGAGGAPAVMPELTCDYYCKLIDDATDGSCVGDQDQYADTLGTSCAKVCPNFPEGSLADTTMNTLGCRIYHAGVAGMADNAAAHCPHAGPFGDDQCGSPCESFCALSEKLCTDAMAPFKDNATCMTECAAFAKDPKYNASEKNVTAAGNTFACRAYHLTAAAVQPATHCAHVKTMSDPCK